MSNIVSTFPCQTPIKLEKLTNEFGDKFFHLHLNEFEFLYIGVIRVKNILAIRHFSTNEDGSLTLLGKTEVSIDLEGKNDSVVGLEVLEAILEGNRKFEEMKK